MIEQLDFYMNQASPELIESRREYVERVIVGKLKWGIEKMRAWPAEFAAEQEAEELIAVYEAAIRFFTERGFNKQAA